MNDAIGFVGMVIADQWPVIVDDYMPAVAPEDPLVGDNVPNVPQEPVEPRRRTAITADKIAIAVAMFNNGQSSRAVATALGCSIRKAHVIRKDTAPGMVGEVRKCYQPKKRGRKPHPEGKEIRQQMVRNILSGAPHLQQAAISEMLPVPVHVSTVSRDIHAIGYTRKELQTVPFERNKPENIQRRQQYAAILNQIGDQRLVFLDETGHNLHLSTTHGYSPAGQPAVHHLNANRGQNLTAIVAIGVGGMMHYK